MTLRMSQKSIYWAIPGYNPSFPLCFIFSLGSEIASKVLGLESLIGKNILIVYFY